MFTSRKFASFALGALMLSLIAAGIAWALRQHSQKTLRLPDGTQFVLSDATFGTNHVHHYGALLPPMASPLLSAKLKKRFGLYDTERQTPIPALMLWGHWSGVKTSYPPNVLTLMDRSGVESDQLLGFPLPSPKQQAEPEYAWKALNYPRREKNLHINIYEYSNSGDPPLRGTLSVPNPAPGPYPRWTPLPFPITTTNGPLICTLESFNSGQMALASYNPRHPRIVPAHTALLKITRQGEPASQWEPWKLQLTDATGNLLEPAHANLELVGDYIAYTFSGVLWPSENAWNLKTELIRNAQFESNEIWTISNLSAPTNSSPAQLATNAEVQGAIISILTINRVSRFSQIEGLPRQNAEVSLLISTPEAGVHVRLLQASDQENRPIPFGRKSLDPSGWLFPLQIGPDARSLNFQFAIQKPWTTEFVTGLCSPPKTNTFAR